MLVRVRDLHRVDAEALAVRHLGKPQREQRVLAVLAGAGREGRARHREALRQARALHHRRDVGPGHAEQRVVPPSRDLGIQRRLFSDETAAGRYVDCQLFWSTVMSGNVKSA